MNHSDEVFCVYKIDSEYGLYIGITKKKRFKARKTNHHYRGRFGGGFTMTSIYESFCPEHIGEMEEFFISYFDTFENGLNQTKDGKGVFRGSNNFSTEGFKFSEESKKKMSEKRKNLIQEGKVKIPERTKEQIEYTSKRVKESLKGTVKYDLPEHIYFQIFKLYDSMPDLSKEYSIKGINDDVPVFGSYKGAFCYYFATKYKCHKFTIRDLLDGKYSKSKLMSEEELNNMKEWFITKYELPFPHFIIKRRYKSYERAFSVKYCDLFGLSNVGLFNILTDKSGKYDKFRI